MSGYSLKQRNLDVIGSTEFVDVANIEHIPAKIDTGADSSSIWASHFDVSEDGTLSFCLFDTDSPFYTGEVFRRKDFKVVVVRSATGHEQVRYRTHLSLRIKGRKIKALFNLSDRSKNNFPVLIGRRTITGKFLVDVSKNHTSIQPKSPKTEFFQKHFTENPHRFHQEYVKKLGGDISSIKLKERSKK